LASSAPPSRTACPGRSCSPFTPKDGTTVPCPWLYELILQNTKNLIKKALVPLPSPANFRDMINNPIQFATNEGMDECLTAWMNAFGRDESLCNGWSGET
jgi:hypothetical protein